MIELPAIHADDRLTAGIDAGLGPGSGFLDPHLRDALGDGLRHSSEFGDFLDVCPGLVREFVGEGFDEVRAAPGIDLPTGVGLQLQEQLGVARDAGAEVRGEGEGFVEGVGVEALRMTMRGGHRLDAGPDRIVHDVLGGQGPARGLRVCPEAEGLGVAR